MDKTLINVQFLILDEQKSPAVTGEMDGVREYFQRQHRLAIDVVILAERNGDQDIVVSSSAKAAQMQSHLAALQQNDETVHSLRQQVAQLTQAAVAQARLAFPHLVRRS